MACLKAEKVFVTLTFTLQKGMNALVFPLFTGVEFNNRIKAIAYNKCTSVKSYNGINALLFGFRRGKKPWSTLN